MRRRLFRDGDPREAPLEQLLARFATDAPPALPPSVLQAATALLEQGAEVPLAGLGDDSSDSSQEACDLVPSLMQVSYDPPGRKPSVVHATCS